MKKAIICDIDGVLLETGSIFKRIEEQGLTGEDKWDFFNRHANDSEIYANHKVVEMLEHFSKAGYKILFVTARSEEIRRQTRAKIDYELAFLADSPFKFDLFMRNYNDYSASHISKEAHIKALKKDYDILFAIDDDEENCKMFEKNKILSLKVVNSEVVQA